VSCSGFDEAAEVCTGEGEFMNGVQRYCMAFMAFGKDGLMFMKNESYELHDVSYSVRRR